MKGSHCLQSTSAQTEAKEGIIRTHASVDWFGSPYIQLAKLKSWNDGAVHKNTFKDSRYVPDVHKPMDLTMLTVQMKLKILTNFDILISIHFSYM